MPGRNWIGLTVMVLSLCMVPAHQTQASECCPPDLNGDGEIGAADLAALLASWGPCLGCPADINGDGEVGAADLAALLASWGSCAFDFGDDYSNAEAEQIGLEQLGPAGPLLVAADDYERIDRDLDLIRTFEPNLASQFHSMAWVPDELLVGLIKGESEQEYLCLNEYYQVINIQLISQGLQLYLLTFADKLNIEALGPIYAEAPNVNYGEPNGLFGGQNFWEPTDLGGGVWRWDIDDGFLDCFDGCDCHRLYVIETTADGHVTLISFQEVGQSWCEF